MTWLKVLLPVSALILLSTMFLFARSVSPTSRIPFAKFELEERARDQQISSPFLSGQTTFGHNIRVTAASAQPAPQDPKLSHVEGMKANIDYSDGRKLELASGSGTINGGALTAELTDGVSATLSNGFVIQSEQMNLDLNAGTAISESEVTGTGPAGDFRAGRMELTLEDGSDMGRFLFTNGVKLVYTP